MAKQKPSIVPGLDVAPSDLDGKKAPEPAVVRWVARNIDHPDPQPADCPDPFAWTLLRMCRLNPEFTAWFIEKLWSKLLPSRSQVEQGRQVAHDGKPTIELIDRIKAMRFGEEREETEVEVPDVFEGYEPDLEDV